MRRAAALAFAATTLFAVEARAQSGATLVAIVTADPTSSLTRRVRAELEGVGLDVIVLKPPDEGSTARGPLERAARSVGAVAAVRLVASSEGKVEVWVADRVTGKAVVRELDAPESGASDAAVAVGSVELLRASLMELHSSEPPHGDAPATPKLEALALPSPDASATSASAPPRVGLSVSAGAELGVRGLGPSADANLGLWIRATSRLGVRLIGATSLSPADVSTAAGEVAIRSLLLGAMADLALSEVTGTWVPSVAAGVAAAHVSTTGTAIPPYVSASEDAWAAAPIAGLSLAWAFTPGLRLRADGLVAWALPEVKVRTPTADVGGWGDPAVMLSLGLEVLWNH
jgi:hypothetical protein